MKVPALTLSLLATAGLATPVRRDVGQEFYTLRLSSPAKFLDGLYLTTNPNSDKANTTALVVYTSPSKPNVPDVRFYPVLDPSTKLAELRTPSSPSSNTALAVVGTNGLFDFARIADPDGTADELPEGTTVDWTSFRLDEGESAGTVKYDGGSGDEEAEGNWVVFPLRGSSVETKEEEVWGVKWKGGNAWTTTDYLPVEVVYELVKHK
ncbi:hypothetical protein C7999DRAFT_27472 [Corynascus novoguineensis]|uniref:Uncharacterized protein n=1 Tax=Corynascus novoguineensis TaxID=1126955 RepID=A0AAN7HUQ4_9PEZI|nr:hypothetical protein C7999DRAFT_27472 [Corynascus novoguineensis]